MTARPWNHHTRRWPPRLPHSNYSRELISRDEIGQTCRGLHEGIVEFGDARLELEPLLCPGRLRLHHHLSGGRLACCHVLLRPHQIRAQSLHLSRKTTTMTAMSGYFANALYPLYNNLIVVAYIGHSLMGITMYYITSSKCFNSDN